MTEPLVSICVITYNSSETVIETLESFKRQTYKPIELVISDDASKDNTIKIVKNWIGENKQYFTEIKLIENSENHGTAINLDTAIKNSSGKWIKILAGDDKLTPNCIEEFVNYTKTTDKEFFASNLKVFSDDESFDLANIQNWYNKFKNKETLPLNKKKKLILKKLFSAGPTWFFSKKLYNKIGDIEPKYPMLDEWPLLYKLFLSNNDIYALNEYLVEYRLSNKSLSHKKIPNIQHIKDDILFYKTTRRKQMLKNFMLLEVINQDLNYRTKEKNISYYEKTGKIRNDYFGDFYNLLKESVKKIFLFIKRKIKHK